MDQFRYKTYIYNPTGFTGGHVDEREFEDELNRLGSDGWELVSAVSSNAGNGYTREIVCILKKKIETEPKYNN